jgi:gamma-glutamylcysteine synthetase
LTSDQVVEIRELRKKGVLRRVLAERFGVAIQTIDGIFYGRSWTWLK